MLDLDSSRWEELRAAGGNSRTVPQLIRNIARAPSNRDWTEVWEQLAHQWTLNPIAYAAFPHLLALGIEQSKGDDAEFLMNLGRIAAPISAIESCPDNLRAEFDAAQDQAAKIALAAAKDTERSLSEYVCALYAAAALNGHARVSTPLFFVLGTGAPNPTPEAELNCPICKTYLLGTFVEEGIELQSVDERLKPVSRKSRVVPRELPDVLWDDHHPPDDDFLWLVALCTVAQQEQIRRWVCQIYGEGECPVCGAVTNVMSEVVRSRAR